MMNKFATTCVVAVMLSSLAGCVGPTKVTDITKDKQAYLVKNFSPDKLAPDIANPLKHTPPVNLPYRTLTVRLDLTMHKINSTTTQDKDTQDTVVNQMENAGAGYVRLLGETSSNGIPFGASFNLTYLNFLTLASQYVSYSQLNANGMGTVTKINRVDGDLANPKPDATLEVDEEVIGLDHSFTCQSGKFYPAKNILAKLPGNALDLNCTFSKQGILMSKSKLVYLQQYGTYIVVETDGTLYSNVFKITDVTAN